MPGLRIERQRWAVQVVQAEEKAIRGALREGEVREGDRFSLPCSLVHCSLFVLSLPLLSSLSCSLLLPCSLFHAPFRARVNPAPSLPPVLPPGEEVDWRAYAAAKGLTEKQQKLADKIRKRENQIQRLQREIERIKVRRAPALRVLSILILLVVLGESTLCHAPGEGRQHTESGGQRARRPPDSHMHIYMKA